MLFSHRWKVGSMEGKLGDTQFNRLTALGGGGFNDGFDRGSGPGGGITQSNNASGGFDHDGGLVVVISMTMIKY
jgi:hypothetical protein